MKKIILLSLILLSLKGYAQVPDQETKDFRRKLLLTATSEVNDFSRYGLKWGMSMFQAEGFLKDIKLRGKNQIVANGKLFGYWNSELILHFVNNKLKKIEKYVPFKDGRKKSDYQDFFYLISNEINNYLSPLNRIEKLSVRDFYSNNIFAQDFWVYNYGKSLIGFKIFSDKELGDWQVISFFGEDNSDVIILDQPAEEFKKIGQLVYDIFTRKINNSSISLQLKKKFETLLPKKKFNESINRDKQVISKNEFFDTPPIFPNCESYSTYELLIECFNNKMMEHIGENFNYPKAAIDNKIEGVVYTMFKIQEDGTISDIRYSGPDELLEAEALRILKKLPKMIPAKKDNRPIEIPYSIPITFKLN